MTQFSSTDLTTEMQGGHFSATITGTLTGIAKNVIGGFTEATIDIGKKDGSYAVIRFFDSDPIQVDAEIVEQPVIPAPPLPEPSSDQGPTA